MGVLNELQHRPGWHEVKVVHSDRVQVRKLEDLFGKQAKAVLEVEISHPPATRARGENALSDDSKSSGQSSVASRVINASS